MGIIDWFKRTTLEGTIEKELGSFKAINGWGKLEVQKLVDKVNGESVYRINTIRTTALSYESIPIVLSQSQIMQLVNQLEKEI
ncbi:MAG TPA: hypothetical protein VIU46_06610 [Gallionellaceae bacterium]